MNKYFLSILIFLVACVTLSELDESSENVTASSSKYLIESVANEPLLLRQYPGSTVTGCGLSNDDFIKYARERIDHNREFQFIVFISGKPLVGKVCYKRALIFYLK